MARFENGKKYAVTGDVLNEIFTGLETRNVIAGTGIESRKIPGQGTQIWTDPKLLEGPEPWDLIIDDAEQGTVQVDIGTILDAKNKVSSGLNCTNKNATHQSNVGGVLAIKFASRNLTNFTIQKYNSWPTTDDYFVNTDTDQFGNITFNYVLYPLWQFVAPDFSGALGINDTVAALRIAPKANFAVRNSYMKVNDEGARLSVPWLTVGPRVLV